MFDSQEDDLPVDVRSEGEGRGEGLQAAQAVAVLPRRRLALLTQLLLPCWESLDVHKLGASAQRIHPTGNVGSHGIYKPGRGRNFD